MSEIDIHRRGLMLVLSSPSGAGKTTLSRRLLESDGEITMSVSATTRKPRPGEEEGKDYHFLTTEDFGVMRNKGEFLEHAKVFDNYYGTPKGPVEEALSAGRDVMSASNDLVKVFILPPSGHELEKRLNTRAQDPPDVVAGRMAKASDEISHYAEYDYIIVNDDVEKALKELTAILVAERVRRERRVGLRTFVQQLQRAL